MVQDVIDMFMLESWTVQLKKSEVCFYEKLIFF